MRIFADVEAVARQQQQGFIVEAGLA